MGTESGATYKDTARSTLPKSSNNPLRGIINLIENRNENSKAYEDNELKGALKSSHILELYAKFLKAGISYAIVWNLDDEILENYIKLNPIEKLKYKVAQKQQSYKMLR